MRQRTLGILAVALMLAGVALGAGTAVFAYRTVGTAQAPLNQRPLGPGRFGPRFHRPGGGPAAQPGGRPAWPPPGGFQGT